MTISARSAATGKNDYLIEFHNNDVTKAFKVIVQAIDKNDQLIYKEQVVK